MEMRQPRGQSARYRFRLRCEGIHPCYGPQARFGPEPRPGLSAADGDVLLMWSGMAAALGAGRGCVFVGGAAAGVGVRRDAGLGEVWDTDNLADAQGRQCQTRA
jgi:hypothetical protein